MSENVVSLHGTYVPAAPETSKVVIEELERLLDAARSGEIIGIAGSFVHSNKVRSRGLEPPLVAQLAPQASASTNSATTACGQGWPAGARPSNRSILA